MACCPAVAPFERLARAKTADAARRLEDRVAEAADAFDAVVVDVPPLAANQAVAAVNACGRTALVAPATRRGRDGAARMRARVRDLDGSVDAVVATRGTSETADASVPSVPDADPAEAPLAPDGEFGAAVVRATETALGVSLDLPAEADDGLLGGDYL